MVLGYIRFSLKRSQYARVRLTFFATGFCVTMQHYDFWTLADVDFGQTLYNGNLDHRVKPPRRFLREPHTRILTKTRIRRQSSTRLNA